jgi:hypothetical protein
LFSEVVGEALANQDFSQLFSEVAGEALANQDFSKQHEDFVQGLIIIPGAICWR